MSRKFVKIALDLELCGCSEMALAQDSRDIREQFPNVQFLQKEDDYGNLWTENRPNLASGGYVAIAHYVEIFPTES